MGPRGEIRLGTAGVRGSGRKAHAWLRKAGVNRPYLFLRRPLRTAVAPKINHEAETVGSNSEPLRSSAVVMIFPGPAKRPPFEQKTRHRPE